MAGGIGHPCGVNPTYYRRLVRDLDGWSSASELAPGRIRVSVPRAGGGRRTVVVVVTPEQWESEVTVVHGGVESALDRLKQTLLSMEPHQGFAVYADHGWEPSTTGTSPESVLPDAGSGTWTADGRRRFEDRSSDRS